MNHKEVVIVGVIVLQNLCTNFNLIFVAEPRRSPEKFTAFLRINLIVTRT